MRETISKKMVKSYRMVIRALEGIVDGDSINRFLIEKGRERLRKHLERGVKVKENQGFQNNYSTIGKSNYYTDYEKWKAEVGREKYWGINEWTSKNNE